MEAEEEKVDTDSGKPPGISKDDIVFDQDNPYRARAVPRGQTVLERARASTQRSRGTYPDIVEGSDSVRTGTNWGVMAVEETDTKATPQAKKPKSE